MDKLTFNMTVSDALDVFDIESKVQEEFETEYDLKNDRTPSLPANLRTLTPIEVGDLLTKCTTWYEDVIQPDTARAERRMKAAKEKMETVEAALRLEYLRQDPELKKTAANLNASIKSDRRYVTTAEENLVKQAVFDHMDRRAKAWRRNIETVSRIITQQGDEEFTRRMGGRPDSLPRQGSRPHPFASSRRRPDGSS